MPKPVPSLTRTASELRIAAATDAAIKAASEIEAAAEVEERAAALAEAAADAAGAKLKREPRGPPPPPPAFFKSHPKKGAKAAGTTRSTTPTVADRSNSHRDAATPLAVPPDPIAAPKRKEKGSPQPLPAAVHDATQQTETDTSNTDQRVMPQKAKVRPFVLSLSGRLAEAEADAKANAACTTSSRGKATLDPPVTSPAAKKTGKRGPPPPPPAFMKTHPKAVNAASTSALKRSNLKSGPPPPPPGVAVKKKRGKKSPPPPPAAAAAALKKRKDQARQQQQQLKDSAKLANNTMGPTAKPPTQSRKNSPRTKPPPPPPGAARKRQTLLMMAPPPGLAVVKTASRPVVVVAEVEDEYSSSSVGVAQENEEQVGSTSASQSKERPVRVSLRASSLLPGKAPDVVSPKTPSPMPPMQTSRSRVAAPSRQKEQDQGATLSVSEQAAAALAAASFRVRDSLHPSIAGGVNLHHKPTVTTEGTSPPPTAAAMSEPVATAIASTRRETETAVEGKKADKAQDGESHDTAVSTPHEAHFKRTPSGREAFRRWIATERKKEAAKRTAKRTASPPSAGTSPSADTGMPPIAQSMPPKPAVYRGARKSVVSGAWLLEDDEEGDKKAREFAAKKRLNDILGESTGGSKKSAVATKGSARHLLILAQPGRKDNTTSKKLRWPKKNPYSVSGSGGHTFRSKSFEAAFQRFAKTTIDGHKEASRLATLLQRQWRARRMSKALHAKARREAGVHRAISRRKAPAQKRGSSRQKGTRRNRRRRKLTAKNTKTTDEGADAPEPHSMVSQPTGFGADILEARRRRASAVERAAAERAAAASTAAPALSDDAVRMWVYGHRALWTEWVIANELSHIGMDPDRHDAATRRIFYDLESDDDEAVDADAGGAEGDVGDSGSGDGTPEVRVSARRQSLLVARAARRRQSMFALEQLKLGGAEAAVRAAASFKRVVDRPISPGSLGGIVEDSDEDEDDEGDLDDSDADGLHEWSSADSDALTEDGDEYMHAIAHPAEAVTTAPNNVSLHCIVSPLDGDAAAGNSVRRTATFRLASQFVDQAALKAMETTREQNGTTDVDTSAGSDAVQGQIFEGPSFANGRVCVRCRLISLCFSFALRVSTSIFCGSLCAAAREGVVTAPTRGNETTLGRWRQELEGCGRRICGAFLEKGVE